MDQIYVGAELSGGDDANGNWLSSLLAEPATSSMGAFHCTLWHSFQTEKPFYVKALWPFLLLITWICIEPGKAHVNLCRTRLYICCTMLDSW